MTIEELLILTDFDLPIVSRLIKNNRTLLHDFEELIGKHDIVSKTKGLGDFTGIEAWILSDLSDLTFGEALEELGGSRS